MFSCPKSVYYPSEDSYFLAENVATKKNAVVIDVGCGSGIQSLNTLINGASKAIALDLNEDALKATKENCEKAGFMGKIETIKSDLFENCSKKKADAIIFNPPYVVSDEVKYVDLDGGKKGRETLDVFLEEFPMHLKENGECFFLQTNLNGEAETEKKLGDRGFTFEIVARKGGFFEELIVYRAKKS